VATPCQHGQLQVTQIIKALRDKINIASTLLGEQASARLE
jgi:hypothetical protein